MVMEIPRLAFFRGKDCISTESMALTIWALAIAANALVSWML